MERKNAIKFLQGWGIVTVALVLAFPLILTPLVKGIPDSLSGVFDATMIGGFVGWSIYTVKAIQAINTVLKSKKPTNESMNPTNPNDDNQKVLDNIQNVLSTSDDNSALQKIEELKRQIENLENSLKKDDLSKEELERLSKREAEKNLKGLGEHRESNQIDPFWIAIVIFILLAILLTQLPDNTF